MSRFRLNHQGIVVPTMVFIMIFLTVSALAVATFAINHYARTQNDVLATNALLTAEAGAEQTLYDINENSAFAGYTSEQEFFNNPNQGVGTYQTEVVAGSIGNEKLIISTGKLYRRAGDPTPKVIRKVRLTVVGTTTGNYAVVTGPGGLIMNNSATIANGDVRVNGFLTMNNSSRIGSATNPLKVYAAHHNCPIGGGATYPVLCNSGEPISMAGTQSHIYGEVHATNQVSGNRMSNPGLIVGSTASTLALPTHDRDAQKAAATTIISGATASCNGSQTRTYQANTKIEGNVSIRNNCIVNVLGNVWITGTLTLENYSRIQVDNSLTSSPYIMVDGSALTVRNSTSILANNNDIGFWFINYYSTAACSPDCANVTGIDLHNSRSVNTITLSNTGLAAGSTFYARWSKVTLSQSGSIGGVIGQTVQLDNTGNISFGEQLSSGATIWSIKNYSQVFD